MTDKTRLYTTLVFLFALLMTMVSALVFQKKFLVFIFVFI
jgi:hypothetical protein